MSRSDDFDRGVKNRRAVLGDEWVERALGRSTAFNADFQSLITRYAWHDVWGRPGLARTTRRLLVLGMTMGMARWEEFELHCRAAVRASQRGEGVTLEQIKETLLQGAIYCGVPAANTAFKITLDILREEGLEPAPQPLTAGVRPSSHHTFSAPQLHVTLQGAGDAVPVVLSHALGSDLRMWDALAGELAAERPVLRYDHRGQGASAAPSGPYGMDDLVDDAARVLREWGRGPVVWIGLSLGGMVGQGVAVRHPELLRGVVLANTAAQLTPQGRAAWAERIAMVESQGMAGVADATMERYFSAAFRTARPDIVGAFRRTLLHCDPAGYAACAHAVRSVDWLDRLADIRMPVLVIAGGKDEGTPPALSQAIAERIAGAELAVLEDAAHISSAEQPQAFAAHVQAFLAGIDAGTGLRPAAPPQGAPRGV